MTDDAKYKPGDSVRWLGVQAKIVERTAPGKYVVEVPDGDQYDAYESELIED